jgi:hypothetical protein
MCYSKGFTFMPSYTGRRTILIHVALYFRFTLNTLPFGWLQKYVRTVAVAIHGCILNQHNKFVILWILHS